MPDIFDQETKRNERHDVWRQWITERVENIHRMVTAHDVLIRHGVRLKYGGREEQISCPFHGIDTKPSARVYEASARSPSHVWCFVCQKSWDVIGLWKKFDGRDDVKFSEVLRDIESAYNLIPPPMPKGPSAEYEPEDEPTDIYADLEVCENRLRDAKKKFEMVPFLKLGVILDRLSVQLERKQVDRDTAKRVIQQVLDKIGERNRACPAD